MTNAQSGNEDPGSADYTAAKLTLDHDALVVTVNGSSTRHPLATSRFGIRDQTGFTNYWKNASINSNRFIFRTITVNGNVVGRLRSDDPAISQLLAVEMLRDSDRTRLDANSAVGRAYARGDRATLAEAIQAARKGAPHLSWLYDEPLLPYCDELASYGTRSESVAFFDDMIANSPNTDGVKTMATAAASCLDRGIPGADTMVAQFKAALGRRKHDPYLNGVSERLNAAELRAAGSKSDGAASTAERWATLGLVVWLLAIWLDHSSWLPRWAARGGNHGVDVDAASREELWKLVPELHRYVGYADTAGKWTFIIAMIVYVIDTVEGAWTTRRAARRRQSSTR